MMDSKINIIKSVGLLTATIALTGFTVFTVFNNVKKVEAATPCVVTVFGKQYDVAPLGTMHPGPKGTTLIDLGGSTFFQCGGDMTSIYQGMHGTDVSRLAPYIYVAPTVTPTTVPTLIPTIVPTVIPTAVPTVIPTGVPTTTPVPSVSPTSTPVPSISPVKDREDDHEEEHENEKHETRKRGKSREHASEQGIASRNEHSQHKDD